MYSQVLFNLNICWITQFSCTKVMMQKAILHATSSYQCLISQIQVNYNVVTSDTTFIALNE